MDDSYANGDEMTSDIEGMESDESYTSIELKIKQDGSMVVCLEAGDEEGSEEETPAKDLKDALRIIEQIAGGVMGGMETPEMAAENQAFAAEMGSPVR